MSQFGDCGQVSAKLWSYIRDSDSLNNKCDMNGQEKNEIDKQIQ